MTYSAPIPMAIRNRRRDEDLHRRCEATRTAARTPKSARLTWKAKARPIRSLSQPAKAAPIASPANVTDRKTEFSSSVEKPVGSIDASTAAESVLSKESQEHAEADQQYQTPVKLADRDIVEPGARIDVRAHRPTPFRSVSVRGGTATD